LILVRIIKAPNVKQERSYRIVEPEKVLRHVDDQAAEILDQAHAQEEAILREAADQSDAIIADAEQQANEIRAQGQVEAEEAREQARQEGIRKDTIREWLRPGNRFRGLSTN